MTGSNDSVTTDATTTQAGETRLAKGDYTKAMLRAWLLQNSFNYSNYQGNGYSYLIYPALRKIHGDDREALCRDLEQNCEFYNTNPNLIPFVTSLHLAMADQGVPYSEIRGLKMALMGPLAGIGDSLSQFCIAPLYSTVFSSLATAGMAFAPVGFWLAINATLLAIKTVMCNLGHKLGTAVIDRLSKSMALISETASMVGVTVIAGLAATFVKMKVGIEFAAGAAEEGVKQSTVNIQGMLDGIAPALLPMLCLMLMYYLIKKRGWNTYQLVILTIVAGVALSAAGILV
ncbi:PTS system mannose/fructose/sorbose family transporter subunit IID [uncultured Parolsenella sp.]|uniref:PTS system mannose/fructose/sorbose family transporter subunit IID n=1 Tax=uncultured Parolsenella sp. TaxID=2083008 RepID=UPI0027DD8D6A|nr:PTS system mannose/fructose/sorbose family transporter subunit IID [uncultured Parolsenella sp.]